MGLLDIHTVEKQHVEVNIQIERRSKTLDQGDRARLGHLVGMARFLDQVRGNDAVNDAQHPPHDLGPAGKQETQLKREAQHPLTHGLFVLDGEPGKAPVTLLLPVLLA
ncbi:hypothetical protein [Escherichia coli IS9]|nr:hypothetical protein [Escherichia coli IS9]